MEQIYILFLVKGTYREFLETFTNLEKARYWGKEITRGDKNTAWMVDIVEDEKFKTVSCG